MEEIVFACRPDEVSCLIGNLEFKILLLVFSFCDKLL